MDRKEACVVAVMTYGAIRKWLHVKDAQVYNYATGKDEPLFVSTKAALIVTGALANTYLWPIYVMKDINTVEAYLRDYKAPKRHLNVLDHFIV